MSAAVLEVAADTPAATGIFTEQWEQTRETIVVPAMISAGLDVAVYGDAWDRFPETRAAWRGYATPATYSVGGKQYVVIAAGGGKMGTKSSDAYVAFALPE